MSIFRYKKKASNLLCMIVDKIKIMLFNIYKKNLQILTDTKIWTAMIAYCEPFFKMV